MEIPFANLVLMAGLLLSFCVSVHAASATGPLRISTVNGRYFTDGTGKAIYLTGSHSWGALQDCGHGVDAPLSTANPPPAFDYNAYLNLLQANNHNFIRLWQWELPKTVYSPGLFYYTRPHPWLRSGAGTANDGMPKFDLNRLDQAYFDRLRARVIAARDRGIYVGIMLFEGWWYSGVPASWQWHPFHASNNVNGINGDANGNGNGEETHTNQIPAVLAVQRAYVRKVIDTVNDLDNVLYEIANESTASGSRQWQYDMINFVKAHQAGKPKKHVVGMTAPGYGGSGANDSLWSSPADWISLGFITARYGDVTDPLISNPPVVSSDKVNISDTDHLGWHCFVNNPTFTRTWVWKSFLRGHNTILMEDFKSNSGWIAGRAAMGHTHTYANKMNLVAMTPQNGLTSTSYCLANVGQEYLVYQAGSGAFSVNLSAKTYTFEWFNPATGTIAGTGSVTAGGGNQTFTPPFSGTAVLYLKASGGTGTNTPPSVSLTIPANGSSFTAPATISVSANASDSNGSVSRVEFYSNGALIGAPDTTSPYSVVWNNVAAGSYSLTAKATDNLGAATTSGTVSVNVTTVGGAQFLPPTIAAPSNGATLGTSATISWTAVSGAAGYLIRCEDLSGTTPRDPRNTWNGGPFLYIDRYASTSITTTVVAGHSYHFWIHSMKSNFSYADMTTWSAASEVRFSSTAGATTSLTFTASSDFSGTQGHRQWSYLDSTGAALVYDSANLRWRGVEAYLWIWAGGCHPGNGRDVIRRWTAPQAGAISITGNVRDLDPNGGAGVVAIIRKNGAELWRTTIVNRNTIGVNFSLPQTVVTGDRIDFVVNRNGDNSYDSTAFNPTVVLTATAAPVGIG
jgi:hypothetical protein